MCNAYYNFFVKTNAHVLIYISLQLVATCSGWLPSSGSSQSNSIKLIVLSPYNAMHMNLQDISKCTLYINTIIYNMQSMINGNWCIDHPVLQNSSTLRELRYSPLQLLLVHKRLLRYDPNMILVLCIMYCQLEVHRGLLLGCEVPEGGYQPKYVGAR